ncbi:single-stranded-DNA-specific exonuclease RecJ, partial [Enterococcus sp. S181_ASV_20]|nr:single-stranded-DNA-specific exonuclease RecJ [Enterococcus sp. S181_ASV_20]
DQNIEGDRILYLAFQTKSQKYFTKELQKTVTLHDPTITWSDYDQVVVLDCPDQKDLLKEIANEGSFTPVSYTHLTLPTKL